MTASHHRLRIGLAASLGVLGCGGETTPSAEPSEPMLPLEAPALAKCREASGAPSQITVATWNMGAARRGSLAEVQAQLEELDADVVLLQEVDVGVMRTGEVHQAAVLAQALGYDYVFAASLPWDGGVFGLATLSRLAISDVERLSLDGDQPELGSEPRIALEVHVCTDAGELRLVNVHADFVEEANANNLQVLGETLATAAATPTLVGGDFNTTVESPAAAGFLETASLVDILAAWDAGPTRREKRIDFLFAPASIADRVTRAARLDTTASDHSVLLVEFTL